MASEKLHFQMSFFYLPNLEIGRIKSKKSSSGL